MQSKVLPQFLMWVGLSCLVFFAACSRRSPEARPTDTTITTGNAYINLFMDSAGVYGFIEGQKLSSNDSVAMLSFYRSRNFQYAWWDSSGITEQVPNFVNLYRNYAAMTGDSSVLNPALDTTIDAFLNDTLSLAPKTDSVRLELLLTRQFFRYVERAYGGDPAIDAHEMDWFIPRKKVDPEAVLRQVMQSPRDSVRQALPVSDQYLKLFSHLERYRKLQDHPDMRPMVFPMKKLSPGDSAAILPALRAKLVALGDLATMDSSLVYDSVTAVAIRHFQRRMGLTEDAIIGPSVQQALNTPPQVWLQRILLNLERTRWLPANIGEKYLFVNIPGFVLYVIEGNELQFKMNVVVGTAAHNTTIFSGSMSQVVMAPYWNVPYSIVKNEMGRTPAYFAKRNMEVVGRYSDGLPMVRQRPGPSNSLGKVKFIFPNSYSIYLHDTPSKGLFGQSSRAFSHGCIRLSDPAKLAYYLLDGKQGWTKKRIDSTMNGSRETIVGLKEKVPVLIAYLTAWVDMDGNLNFRKDIYKHDEKLAARMFGAKAKADSKQP